jgi:hypothetical protein
MTSLLVIVPTRTRPGQCARLLESFRATVKSPDTEILFITDGDDDSYRDSDWTGAAQAAMTPRAYFTAKLNTAALSHAPLYNALMFTGDDHVFMTPGWDVILLGALADMGGTGWVYPDDKRRNDIPEIWLASSDLVTELGWFAPPWQMHFYCDNVIADLGVHSGLIRFVPEAVVEHRHYSADKNTEKDSLYSETEEMFGERDLEAFREWRSSGFAHDVAKLRRAFNPDIRWLLAGI